MCIGIILSGIVVSVMGDGFMWCQFLQPTFLVCMQTGLIIINKHAGCNMHRVYEAQPFLDATLGDELLHLRRDIDKCPSGWDIKPQLFGEGFHGLGGYGGRNGISHFGSANLLCLRVFCTEDIAGTKALGNG